MAIAVNVLDELKQWYLSQSRIKIILFDIATSFLTILLVLLRSRYEISYLNPNRRLSFSCLKCGHSDPILPEENLERVPVIVFVLLGFCAQVNSRLAFDVNTYLTP